MQVFERSERTSLLRNYLGQSSSGCQGAIACAEQLRFASLSKPLHLGRVMSSGWALFTTYSGQVCQAVQVVYQEAVALGPVPLVSGQAFGHGACQL